MIPTLDDSGPEVTFVFIPFSSTTLSFSWPGEGQPSYLAKANYQHLQSVNS